MRIRTTPQKDGFALYVTVEGDMVDLVCWRFYGEESGASERVLDVNPGLAGLGPVLPQGVRMLLPPPPVPTPRPQIRLWD